MENKKIEKKRIFSKLTVGVAALALISCAFVGGTFARYQSSGVVDNGGANIADWYIDVANGSGTAETMFTISPNEAVYNDSEARKNEANNGGNILTFTNRGEVAATITLTMGEELLVEQKTWTKNEDGSLTQTDNIKLTDVNDQGQSAVYYDNNGMPFTWQVDDGETPASALFRPVFQTPQGGLDEYYTALSAAWTNAALFTESATVNSILKLGEVTVESAVSGDSMVTVTHEDNTNVWTFTLQKGQSVSVKIGATSWTSDFTDENDVDGSAQAAYTDGDVDYYKGDLRDTWIGENISRIGYSFTWSAVQASHLPEDSTVTGGGTDAP